MANEARRMMVLAGMMGGLHNMGSLLDTPAFSLPKRSNYSPPKQEVPDFSSMSRQQLRRAKRLAEKRERGGR